jgi:hypothetical protein
MSVMEVWWNDGGDLISTYSCSYNAMEKADRIDGIIYLKHMGMTTHLSIQSGNGE